MTIHQVPRTAADPVFPNVGANLTMGVVAGAAVGLMFAILIGVLRTGVAPAPPVDDEWAWDRDIGICSLVCVTGSGMTILRAFRVVATGLVGIGGLAPLVSAQGIFPGADENTPSQAHKDFANCGRIQP